MRVGILGSGLMGGKLGTLFARAGHEVVFSYARSKEKLNRLARDARGNARADTPREAAQGADALLLAVHWSRIDDVAILRKRLCGLSYLYPYVATYKGPLMAGLIEAVSDLKLSAKRSNMHHGRLRGWTELYAAGRQVGVARLRSSP